VRADSEETLVELRRESRDQLTLPGWQGRRAAHHSLREQRQILRLLGFEREQMHYLRNRDAGRAHLAEHRRVWLARGVVLDVLQEHWLHADMSFIVVGFSSRIPSGTGHKISTRSYDVTRQLEIP